MRWLVALMLCGAAAEGAAERRERVERGLLPASIPGEAPSPPWDIRDRMLHYRVPGVSIAVIRNFELDWTHGYGYLTSDLRTPVNADTLFQCASISKPVAAMGILKLVHDGRIALDEEVNRKLVSWRIPGNEFTAVRPVTARHLLTHMAGTSISGYVGYRPGQILPSLPQMLDGLSPSNSPPVRVEQVPGAQYRYSGGGYGILQQLATDVTGAPFESWMAGEVFAKLGMSRSTFAQPLPPELAANAARGHDETGSTLPGGWMVHPELAAAGLWTTAGDLARFVIEVQQAAAGRSNRVLPPALAREMLRLHAPDWGLGLQVLLEGNVFLHTGKNHGYRSILFAYTHTGDGAVVLTSGDRGEELRLEILRAIAAEYGWPHWRVAGFPAAPALASGNPVVNAASGRGAVAPGSIVSLYGPDLADVTEVLFNGIRGAILGATAQQINATLPPELGPGLVIAQVKRGAVASAGREVRIVSHAPGIFLLAHADTLRRVTELEPAEPGESLVLFATGLGGAAPAVAVDGLNAEILTNGPVPGFPGADQIHLRVPANAPRGPAVPVVLKAGEAESNSVAIAIR